MKISEKIIFLFCFFSFFAGLTSVHIDFAYAAGSKLSVLKADCEAHNDGDACTKLGYLYAHGSGDSISKDYVEAEKYYKKSCALNQVEGCRFLGFLYTKGEGLIKDYSQANKFFQKACDFNDGSSCYNLGLSYEKGYGVEQNYKYAAMIYKKGCHFGDGMGCNNLGVIYGKGLGDFNKDLEKAHDLFQKSCNLNEKKGCDNLAESSVEE